MIDFYAHNGAIEYSREWHSSFRSYIKEVPYYG